MRSELPNGYVLRADDSTSTYKIEKVIGKGSSCLVYLAEGEKEGMLYKVILKEYNPKNISLPREGGALLIREEKKKEFEDGIKRFEAGIKKQASIRLNSDLTNSTSNIQDIISANNTKYVVMTFFNGTAYNVDRYPTDISLHNFLIRMKALTAVIGNYHKAGYLHLDIKPDNIYAIPESSEIVMLFDFDSLVEKEQIKNKTAVLSYTKEWAAVEQTVPSKMINICEATDIFSIGEIIFYRIFGRHSDISERRSFLSYEFDHNTEIFKNVNPKVFPLLNTLLKKTICNVIKERCQNTDELIEKLCELIRLSDPKEPFLVSTSFITLEFFIGRDKELRMIHEKLQEKNILFISGLAGIGKTVLAKNYAKKYADCYETVLFAVYNSSLEILINDDSNIHIANFEPLKGEKSEKYYSRKIKILKELCNNKTLLIIDNLNENEFKGQEKQRKDIFGLNCKILVTTRLNTTNSNIRIGEFQNPEDLIKLFDTYCKIKNEDEKQSAKEIISYFDGHTLAVELIAKQINSGFSTPTKMLQKLKERGISKCGKENVILDKDNKISRKTPFEHISEVFDIADFDESKKYILANMSLIPRNGIKAELFADWCNLENYNDINSLVESGWVYREDDTIKIHPLIAEVSQAYAEKNPEILEKYLESVIYEIKKLKINSVFSKDIVGYMDIYSFAAEKLLKYPTMCDIGIYYLSIAEDVIDGYFSDTLIESCLKKALEFSVNKYGDDFKITDDIRKRLYTFYLKNKQSEKTQDYLKKIRRIDTLMDTQDYIVTRINEGAVYLSQKNFDKALECYNEVLDYCEKNENKYIDDKIYAYGGIGRVYDELKDFKQAEEYYKKGLELNISLHGEINDETAKFYTNLGDIMRRQEKFKAALSYFEEALKIKIEIYGDKHRDVAKAYITLGSVYCNSGDFIKSEYYNKKALEIYLEIYGDTDINTALAYRNLGELYGRQKLFEKAKKYSLQALEIRKNFYKDNSNHEVLEMYMILSLIYKEHGDMKQSSDYMRKYLENAKELPF